MHRPVAGRGIQGVSPQTATPDQQHALLRYFGGDEGLFTAFGEACIAQFPQDLAQGQAACTAADWPALRRTAHNLKSVLLTLGYPALSQEAEACEEFSQLQHADSATNSWARLHAGVAAAFAL